MKDIAQNQAVLQSLLAVLICVAVLIGGLLLIFFNWYIHRIENVIACAQNDLQAEIEKRSQLKGGLRQDHTKPEPAAKNVRILH